MLKVGLTGGIACGKSYVLRKFRKRGVCTIDADEIAHRVILPDGPAYRGVLEMFGEKILSEDGTIDRKKLGQLVFSSPELREGLNAIVHPYVLQEEERRMEALEKEDEPSSIVMVDAALMVEVGSYRKYDFVIVVYCHPKIQLQRVMDRDGLSEREARQRIDSQMPLLEKIKYADFIIETSGTLRETDEQVNQIFAELMLRYEEDMETPKD